MKNCFNFKSIISKGDVIGLGTCYNNIPNIVACKIIDISNSIIIIGDVKLNKTLKNILKNNNVSIYCYNKGYFQLKGKAKYYNDCENIHLSNELFNLINLNYKSKGLLKIKINKIYKL